MQTIKLKFRPSVKALYVVWQRCDTAHSLTWHYDPVLRTPGWRAISASGSSNTTTSTSPTSPATSWELHSKTIAVIVIAISSIYSVLCISTEKIISDQKSYNPHGSHARISSESTQKYSHDQNRLAKLKVVFQAKFWPFILNYTAYLRVLHNSENSSFADINMLLKLIYFRVMTWLTSSRALYKST